MIWDFHSNPVIPECLRPIAYVAFFMLFVGSLGLWIEYMRWTLRIGKEKRE